MSSPPPFFVLVALIAGAIWGVIGLLCSGQILGSPVWGGVLAAPLVGVAVGLLFRGFRGRPLAMRITLALVSLYFGAGLFALATGVTDAMHPVEHRDGIGVVLQTVVGVWWGITFTGLLPLLWPLAYVTHTLLGRLDRPAPGTPS